MVEDAFRLSGRAPFKTREQVAKGGLPVHAPELSFHILFMYIDDIDPPAGCCTEKSRCFF